MRIDPDAIEESRPGDREIALLADEVRRLRAVVASGEPALTDEEEEAVWFAIAYAQNAQHPAEASLRGLLRMARNGAVSARETGYTFVEVLAALAIIATLVALVLPVALLGRPNGTAGDPPATIHLWTVEHDGHWWVKSIEHFSHHPDCPCSQRTPEASHE